MTPTLARMAFPEQLVAYRKAKDWTQAELARAVGISIPQLQRYEAGTSQPTLDVIKKLAKTLGVTADALIFEANERGPDDELRLQFEAISQFTPEEKRVAKTLLESLIIRHDSYKWRDLTGQPAKDQETKEAG